MKRRYAKVCLHGCASGGNGRHFSGFGTIVLMVSARPRYLWRYLVSDSAFVSNGCIERFFVLQVDKESRIISDAYPYIASRLLTDSAPELQSALQQLLFKDGKPRSAIVQEHILVLLFYWALGGLWWLGS